jgi:hypothetical protein
MSYSIAARICLALGLIAGGGTGAFAWSDRCDCEPYVYYGPAPVYVYDHSTGPTWTSNGWSYPPVGAYYPIPATHAPSATHLYRSDISEYGYRDRPRHRPMRPLWR